MEANPFAPPKAVVADDASISGPQAHFFAVSVLKLVVMSVGTLGLYQIYWFYKHWAMIKERSEPHITPWARALFGIFWCYSCFDFIRKEERQLDIEPTLHAGLLAFGWIGLELASQLPGPYYLCSLLAPLLLIPVQVHVNQINMLAAPGHDRNARFTVWNWLALIGTGIIIGFVMLGLAQVAVKVE
jgi:hypothetical protein